MGPTKPLHFALGALLWGAISLYGSPEAQELYEQSAKLFSFKNLQFQVNSRIETEDRTQERSFFVAKRQEHNASSLIIRFHAPDAIKCTAILVEKRPEARHHYLYFPALKRVRMIPDREIDSEAMGMGISYAELDAQSGDFAPLETIEVQGETRYRVTMEQGVKRSIYEIDKASLALKKVAMFRKGKPTKIIDIDAISHITGDPIITQWRIHDLIKSRTLYYTIDERSISQDISPHLFQRNRLQRCRF